MTKRGYKQMKNRLYREIKRRIQAEQAKLFVGVQRYSILESPLRRVCVEKAINSRAIPFNDEEYTEFVKTDMAYDLAKRLKADGIIKYISCHDTIADCVRVRAEITVVEGE